MSSGSTHDRITLWSLPVVASCTYIATQSSDRTLIVSGAFLFSGLMFGPDLDIYSVQYKRWGYLRWLWLPYQKAIKHRSLLSHGVIIGTTLRLLYLAAWISLLGVFSLLIAQLWGFSWNWLSLREIDRKLTYSAIALFVGLEIGAISHIVSDRLSSYKRQLRRGKIKKSKSNRPIKAAKPKSR
ncbi:metal-binding protein [Aliterella atlantica]|uniref:Metal-binding protein n=1 Tax=Aliterella atlantica CENA595 TaxID=1618023 RepID=A0A0D8ZLY0_9CYAN|nr:metal-binding protein [Aliterella atlantica]KJH69444.1 metal-binding protein [Aliterella atlantica CENA595]